MKRLIRRYRPVSPHGRLLPTICIADGSPVGALVNQVYACHERSEELRRRYARGKVGRMPPRRDEARSAEYDGDDTTKRAFRADACSPAYRYSHVQTVAPLRGVAAA